MTRGRLTVLVGIAVMGIVAALLLRRSQPEDGGALVEVEPLALSASACVSAEPPALDRDLELAVFRGEGVSDQEVEQQLGQAAGFFADYRVRLQRRASVPLGRATLMEGSPEAIDEALREAGIEPRRAPPPERLDEARRITCDVALGPLRAFLKAQPREGDRILVVVLRRIAEPGSPLAAMLPDLRGLTLTPKAMSESLGRCLGVEGPFAPTVLLGLDAITARRPGTLDVTLAHELGHVLGLLHEREAGDLMAVEPPKCLPRLSEAQLARLKGE
ncbi:MAG: hypothetical protein R3B72_12020 [Polyangiaceae bacterium]